MSTWRPFVAEMPAMGRGRIAPWTSTSRRSATWPG
jgi:hypothetical protein